MKKLIIIFSMVLSISSFTIQEGKVLETPPVTANTSSDTIPPEDFLQNMLSNIDAEPEIMSKMDTLGEEVDNEIQKANPDWKKVERLYNELSVYTNKIAVDMMKNMKGKGVEKQNSEFEEEINEEVIADMLPDGEISSNPVEEKEVLAEIDKEMSPKELARMDELSSNIALEINKENPDWIQVERDYNELSKYTNKITVIIIRLEKNKEKTM
ncbi:hypothetical protein [uncultured Cetobacterium sp.]|uniref:hypothetical protein n=1 Tax=uncultured Cetobacterium sp. TaxID=527638 RepID=UPI0026186E55|nr:hypothetical protein [uncultured Cetobacterium sp.]